MIRFAIALVLAFFVADSAFAQRADDMKPVTPARRPALTGNIGADIKNAINGDGSSAASSATRQQILQTLAQPFQDLSNFIGDDAENAITLSTSIPGVQDGHGQQCWIAARNFTAVFKAHPLPLTGQAMTDLEALRLLAISSKQLCEDTHCTQVFTDFKNMAITVAQATVGAIGATAVRSAPSLQDICTQVPNVPLAEAISPVPPAPQIVPVGIGAPATPAVPATPAAPQ